MHQPVHVVLVVGIGVRAGELVCWQVAHGSRRLGVPRLLKLLDHGSHYVVDFVIIARHGGLAQQLLSLLGEQTCRHHLRDLVSGLRPVSNLAHFQRYHILVIIGLRVWLQGLALRRKQSINFPTSWICYSLGDRSVDRDISILGVRCLAAGALRKDRPENY